MTDNAAGGLTPEREARQKIDAQLAACGWVVQDHKSAAVAAARGVAVREVPVGAGWADYVLFVDCQAVGVIEAKPVGTTLTGWSRRPWATGSRIPMSCRCSRWMGCCRSVMSPPAWRRGSPAVWIRCRRPGECSASIGRRRWLAGVRIGSRPVRARCAAGCSCCPILIPKGCGLLRPRRSAAWRRRCGTTGRGR